MKFRPHIRGKIVNDGPTLNVSNITSFGIQVIGGVNEKNKTFGKSFLILYRIRAALFERT